VLKSYYYLTKPGIVWGNAITATAGYFLAAGRHFNPLVFGATIVGLSLVVAASCVYNNYIDRGIDQKMSRTKNRALASGQISPAAALIFGTVLALAGVATLALFTNLLATATALFGMFAYVVVYGYWKRRSWVGTIVGSVSGAIPPVVGYTAVTGNLSWAAFILFLTVVFWQMPHFYAIAINRSADYESAGIPVLPLKKGLEATRWQILFFIVAYVVTSLSLYVFGYAGIIYLVSALIIGLCWLIPAVRGFRTPDIKAWARQMFGYSLMVICLWCIAICVDAVVR